MRDVLVAALREPDRIVGLPPVELDLLLQVARRSRLLGRIASDLESCGLIDHMPAVAADQLRSALIATEARQRVARWELNRVAWTLDGMDDVSVVALKGCAYVIADLPNAAGRSFGDIDLLVPEDRLRAVEERLLRRGWHSKELTPYDDRYYREWAHELPPLMHTERGVELDLHHNIVMRTARLKPSAKLLLEAARSVPGSRIKVLAPVDMVLHAVVHLFYGGEMDDAVRELVDIDVLLRHFGATEPGFWDQFWPRAEQLDLARPAFYGLRYASRLLGTTVPEDVYEASQIGAPVTPMLAAMDRMLPLVLFPQHPNRAGRVAGGASLALYMRSHWVKMPLPMLVFHLTNKLTMRPPGS